MSVFSLSAPVGPTENEIQGGIGDMNTPWKTMLRWTSVLVVLVAIAFGTVRSAQAFEVNEDGVIPEGEVIDDDVLIGGNNVVINGTVNGDVFAFGSIVTLNGVITGSLVVGASALDLGSEAVVGRNVLFGGFSMSAKEGSSVGRDLLAAGYQTLLSGEVDRDVKVSVAALDLAGTVGGEVEATVEGPTGAGHICTLFAPPGAPPMV